MQAKVYPIYKNDLRFSKRLRNSLIAVLVFCVWILIYSCGGTSKTAESPTPPTGDKNIVAAYLDTSGYWQVDIITRGIWPKLDSNKVHSLGGETVFGSKVNGYDTLYARKVISPLIDSLTKLPKLDSTGNKIFKWHWQYIGKDSVDINIQNKDIDSLLKARNKKQ